MTASSQNHLSSACDLIEQAAEKSARIVVGIAGPPASGKSTLAQAVVTQLNEQIGQMEERAVLLPMDGYHLDNRILEKRGLLNRKGAPETFDANGFCAAVELLARAERESFHPTFDRSLDIAVAGAISISRAVPIIVVEGNDLLLNSAPWSELKQFFSVTVFISPQMETLKERLVQRWVDHGMAPEAALERAMRNDLPNAKTVLDQSGHADLILA